MVFLSSEQSVSVAFVVISWSSTQKFQPIPIFFSEHLLALRAICDQIQAKHSDTNPSYWRLPEWNLGFLNFTVSHNMKQLKRHCINFTIL